MRSTRLIAFALAAFAVACSGADVTTLTITATPDRIEIASGKFVLIEVRGRVGDVPLYEGSEITLSTDHGSFIPDGSEQVQMLQIEGQRVTAKLHVPTRPQTATVTARYVDPYGVEVKATTTVTFVVPTVSRLNFSCAAKNIGAFVTTEDMAVRCEATPVTEDGQVVRNAQVRFLTEAGSFRPYEGGEGGVDSRLLFTYSPTGGAAAAPKDVMPEGEEPAWTDPVSGRVHNPRDGLATLVAYVASPNDGLQGEPYVDENDNDKYDPGEPFFDTNGDGVWNSEQDTHIWKAIKILWTGKNSSSICASVTCVEPVQAPQIERKATQTFNFTLLDQNLNVLAANDPANDMLSWNIKEGTATIIGYDTTPFLSTSPFGMDIDPNTYRIRNRGAKTSYLIGARYTLTVRNDNEQVDENDRPVSEPLQILATVERALAKDEDGAPTASLSEEMAVTGQATLK